MSTNLDQGPLRVQSWRTWHWLWPLLASAMFLLLLALFVRLVHDEEKEEQHRVLVSDMLWVEQDIRLQVLHDQEQLQKLAEELGSGQLAAVDFSLRAQRLQAINPELAQIDWLDASGNRMGNKSGTNRSVAPWMRDGTFTLAMRAGSVYYGGPYEEELHSSADNHEARLAVLVPIVGPTGSQGAVVGVFSLPALLQQMVPWWFTEKYRLTLADGNSNVLAAKSNVEAERGAETYSVALDPPGQGMHLQAAVYGAQVSWTRYLLVALIASLVLLLSWSLWALRRDIHRRAAAERALMDEHAFRQAMEDSLRIGLRARDLAGRIVYVNRAFCEMVGWTAQELVGQEPPMPYWTPEAPEQTRTPHEAAPDGDAPDEGFELCLRRRDGMRIDVFVCEAPLISGQRQQVGWMGSFLDITERKRAEEFVRHQQERLQLTSRLVTMGEMASTMAHEINQPLSAIAGYNTACLNMLGTGNVDRVELVAALEKLGRQAERAGSIIRRIYEFVQKNEPELVICDVNDVIESAVEFIAPVAQRRDMRIVTNLADSLPPISGDQVLLEQVVLNLVRNGLDSMQDQALPQRLLRISSAADGDHVRVSVSDQGHGLAPDSVDKLFTPFYSTKSEGMGMGLNICRSILEFHGGRVWTEKNPSGGAVFHFTLPAVPVESVAVMLNGTGRS